MKLELKLEPTDTLGCRAEKSGEKSFNRSIKRPINFPYEKEDVDGSWSAYAYINISWCRFKALIDNMLNVAHYQVWMVSPYEDADLMNKQGGKHIDVVDVTPLNGTVKRPFHGSGKESHFQGLVYIPNGYQAPVYFKKGYPFKK